MIKKKCWYIDRGQRWLLKEHEVSSSQQSLNEILATEIHRLQAKQPYTEYQLVPHPEGIEKGYCCISPAFTNERIEFINAYDLVSSEKKPNDRSYYEHFIHICAEHGLPEEKTRNFDSPVSLEQLPSDQYLYNLYQADQMAEERIDSLVRVFRQKQEMMKQFLIKKKLVIPGKKYTKKPRVSLR